jgi:hypothetical protein
LISKHIVVYQLSYKHLLKLRGHPKNGNTKTNRYFVVATRGKGTEVSSVECTWYYRSSYFRCLELYFKLLLFERREDNKEEVYTFARSAKD